jgi:AAA+ superfamily predicted ATPase
MSKPNYIIETSKLTPQELNVSYEYSFMINTIRDFIKTKVGLESRLYDLGDEFCSQAALWEDTYSGAVEEIGLISDVAPNNYFELQKGEDEEEKFFGSIRNRLFYYKEFDVVIGTMLVAVGNGRFDSLFLTFASDDEHAKAYLNHVRERSNNKEKGKITILTDTVHGTTRRTETVKNILNRDDVLLNNDLKNQIFRFIDQFFNDEGSFYTKYKIPYRRGILLFGKPGNGKTTLIRSMVGDMKIPIFYWQVTEFSTSGTLTQVFEYLAEVDGPVLLVIEDIDSLPSACRSIFLNHLDGVNTKEGVFIIGTTNFPEKIDPALMNRAGRFDRSYEILPPDNDMRRKYLNKKGIIKFINSDQLEDIIKVTDGHSMSILNEIYISCALYHHYDGSVDIDVVMEQIKSISEKQQSGKFFTSDKKPNQLGFAPTSSPSEAKSG